jgi:DNA primase
MDHLAKVGLGEAAAALLRDPSLPFAARPDAQPKEALDGWWHFFALLRGEADLLDDQAAARRAWADSTDAEEQERAQRRLVRLQASIAALRRGEWGENEDEPAGGAGNGDTPGGHPGSTP